MDGWIVEWVKLSGWMMGGWWEDGLMVECVEFGWMDGWMCGDGWMDEMDG